MPGMNRDTFSPCNVTDNIFPTDWVTTSRSIDEQVVVAANLDGGTFATKDTPHHAGETTGLFGAVVGSTGRCQLREDRFRRVLAITESGHQVVDAAEAIFGGGLQ